MHLTVCVYDIILNFTDILTHVQTMCTKPFLLLSKGLGTRLVFKRPTDGDKFVAEISLATTLLLRLSEAKSNLVLNKLGTLYSS